MSKQLKRKHLADGVYFVWRCEHNNGKQDRASDRNDGPEQGECDVDLVAQPDRAHRRIVAHVEFGQALTEFHQAIDKVTTAFEAIRRDLRQGEP